MELRADRGDTAQQRGTFQSKNNTKYHLFQIYNFVINEKARSLCNGLVYSRPENPEYTHLTIFAQEVYS